ncbi:Protein Aster-C [Tritrichomonas musculus]|uniref:Protein Aster-C n=1 Tax=Tritrichomonas musculus TaxID=1915356 RepID=A0ABR2ILM1_9EUKA
MLHVKAIEATDVPKMDIIGQSDPYLVFKLSSSDKTWKTEYKNNTSTPVWNEEFHLPLSKNLDDHLTIELYDKDFKFDDLISTIVINVNLIPAGKEFNSWYNFNPVEGVKKGGRVRLSFLVDDPNNASLTDSI